MADISKSHGRDPASVSVFPLMVIVQVWPFSVPHSLPGIDSTLMGAERAVQGRKTQAARAFWGLRLSLFFLAPLLGQALGRRIFFLHFPVYLSICLFLCVFTYLLKMQELSPVQWEALWWLWEYTERRWDSHLAFEELNVGGNKRHEPRPW